MSRTHANRGKSWEDQLDAYHYLLEAAGRAVVTRNHPEVIPQRNRAGKVVGVSHRTTGAPDYTLLSGGLTIIADAKSTQENRWPLRLLKPHQAKTLTDVEKQGGLSLLLVCTPDGSYAALWSAVRPCWERWQSGQAGRGEASLTHDQLVTFSVCWARRGVGLDYLRPALEQLQQREAG